MISAIRSDLAEAIRAAAAAALSGGDLWRESQLAPGQATTDTLAGQRVDAIFSVAIQETRLLPGARTRPGVEEARASTTLLVEVLKRIPTADTVAALDAHHDLLEGVLLTALDAAGRGETSSGSHRLVRLRHDTIGGGEVLRSTAEVQVTHLLRS